MSAEHTPTSTDTDTPIYDDLVRTVLGSDPDSDKKQSSPDDSREAVVV